MAGRMLVQIEAVTACSSHILCEGCPWQQSLFLFGWGPVSGRSELKQAWERSLSETRVEKDGQVAATGGEGNLSLPLCFIPSPSRAMYIHFLGNYLDLRSKESLAPLPGTGRLNLWARSGSQEAVEFVQPLVSAAKSWAPLLNA